MSLLGLVLLIHCVSAAVVAVAMLQGWSGNVNIVLKARLACHAAKVQCTAIHVNDKKQSNGQKSPLATGNGWPRGGEKPKSFEQPPLPQKLHQKNRPYFTLLIERVLSAETVLLIGQSEAAPSQRPVPMMHHPRRRHLPKNYIKRTVPIFAG